MKKRGQAATEAIIVVTLVLFILLFIIAFREDVMGGISGGYYSAKTDSMLDDIVNSAALVYQQGEGAKKTSYVNIPKEVSHLNLTGRVLNVTMNISGKSANKYRKTDFLLNGTLPAERGSYCLLFESFKGHVEVNVLNGSC